MSEIWGTYLFFIILLLGGGAIFEGAYILELIFMTQWLNEWMNEMNRPEMNQSHKIVNKGIWKDKCTVAMKTG